MKKIRPKKLSAKIVLTLLLIVSLMMMFMSVLRMLMQLIGIEFSPIDLHDSNEGLYILVQSIILIVGVVVVVIFSYVIDKTIVERIRKLNIATKQIMSGDYAVSLEVKNTDELSELAHSFNEMATELRLNEYLSKEFIRNISHEFKTPLSSIRAYGELIENESNEQKINASSLNEYAKVITEEVDRLTNLSKNILQLSLLESTTITKKEDIFYPSEQVRNILKLVKNKWMNKNISFELKLEEQIVTSNEQLLYQVWQNLIVNAIKYSNNDSKIQISLAVKDECVNFKIINHGLGIAPEDSKKIFNHFFMSDKSRQEEGNGLGLTITKKIIEKLGGEISFQSEKNKETIFYVRV